MSNHPRLFRDSDHMRFAPPNKPCPRVTPVSVQVRPVTLGPLIAMSAGGICHVGGWHCHVAAARRHVVATVAVQEIRQRCRTRSLLSSGDRRIVFVTTRQSKHRKTQTRHLQAEGCFPILHVRTLAHHPQGQVGAYPAGFTPNPRSLCAVRSTAAGHARRQSYRSATSHRLSASASRPLRQIASRTANMSESGIGAHRRKAPASPALHPDKRHFCTAHRWPQCRAERDSDALETGTQSAGIHLPALDR